MSKTSMEIYTYLQQIKYNTENHINHQMLDLLMTVAKQQFAWQAINDYDTSNKTTSSQSEQDPRQSKEIRNSINIWKI